MVRQPIAPLAPTLRSLLYDTEFRIMEKLDLIQALGNATCIRTIVDTQACTLTESWNFGALIVVGVLVSLTLLAIRERSRRRRENNYYW